MTEQSQVSLRDAIDPTRPVTITPLSEVAQPAAKSAQPILETPAQEATRPPQEASAPKQEGSAPSPEQKFTEARTIVETAVMRRAQEITKNGANTDADRSIQSYGYFLAHKNNPQLELSGPIDARSGAPIRLHLKGGKYEAVAQGGNQVLRINTKVVENGTVFFECEIQDVGTERIPADQIIKAQIIAEKDVILGSLAENNQKMVAQAYIDKVISGDVGPNGEPELDLEDTTIKEAGKETGLFPAESVVSFAGKVKDQALSEEILGLVDGKNIVEPSVMAEVLIKANNIPQKRRELDMATTELNLKISELDSQIQVQSKDSDPHVQQIVLQLQQERAQYKAQLNQVKAEMDELAKLQSQLPKDGELATVLQGMSPDQVRDFCSTLESTDDMEKILKSMLASDKLSADQKAHFEQLTKGLTIAGAGIAALVIVMIMQAMNSQG